MATTTDFDAWLGFVEPDNYEEVYCIYRAISDVAHSALQKEEWGAFTATKKVVTNGNMYFLKCDYSDDILMMTTEKARKAFISILTKKYVDQGMDIEGWYIYKRSIEKDD